MAEPVREQVQNLNLSAQDSRTADLIRASQVDQPQEIMADTDSQNLQQDASVKHTSNGDTNMDLNKGDSYEENMYVEDSSEEDDDFEYSKSENMEQRVPVSFGDENVYNEQKNTDVEPGAPQFGGFQPFFPQGYQEEITPSKNPESVALFDNGSASQGQLQSNNISEPPVSNQDMLIDFDKPNETMDSQPANMQDMNPFLDNQSSQMYSDNPFMDDLDSAGVTQQVVPEAYVEDVGTCLSQTPDLILIGDSSQPVSHDTQVSNQSLSETNGFDKAQNVIDSIAHESNANDNVPVSEISPSVPEIAICDDQSRSLDSSHDQDYESHDQDFESHVQESKFHDQEYESHDQDSYVVIASAQEMVDSREESAEHLQDFEQDKKEFVCSEENQFSKQMESPGDDINERCMGLIEPTQIVPEDEISQDPLQEVVGSDSEIDQRCHSPDIPPSGDYQQDVSPSFGGSISVEESKTFETDQIADDVSKSPVDVSSSEQSSGSQPPLDMRETGMSGSIILESGQTFDNQHDEYPDDVSKSLTQGSSDEGEAEDLIEQDSGLDTGMPTQMTSSAMEDSIVLDEGETFDDQPQFGNEMTGSMTAESFNTEERMDSQETPRQELVQSENNQKLEDEIPNEMSTSLMEDSIVLGEGETFDTMKISDEREQTFQPGQEIENENIENDYIPQNGSALQQEIPDIHYQQYDSQSGEIIETSGELIDTQAEDYIDDISSEESQDHLETSQRLAEEISEHKDFTHRHPSELEVQKEMDQGYFEQREELDTPGEMDEDELYEHEHPDMNEHDYQKVYNAPEITDEPIQPVQTGHPHEFGQQAEPSLEGFGFEEKRFEQFSEPVQEFPTEAMEPEPSVQVLVHEQTKEMLESVETKTSQSEEVKSESISEISKISAIKDSKGTEESPKKIEVIKSTEKKKEEKEKSQKTESVTKKEISSKVTQKTSRKAKPATPREDAGKIPSPTKTSTPKAASTATRRSPTKSAEPTKSKSATPATGSKPGRPVSASTPKRPVSATGLHAVNPIPLRKSLPSPEKNATLDKKSPVSPTTRDTTQVSSTKRETTPRIPSRPRTASHPRPKKDASSDSGVEEDKTSRKTTTTVTQKKKTGTTVTTQKTTSTTVKKTETKNGPLTTDSRKSSAGTRTGVSSKIGSMENARHSPGGGNVRITTKKTDYSTVGSRIGSKANIEHKAGGGEKKVITQKLEWKKESKIGSLENSKHSPGGGNVKILNEKVDWKTQSKIGSLDNAKHSPGGGNVKITHEKLQWNAKSKCGSMENAQHVPGGGDVKIETKKLEFEKVQSKVGSKDNIKHAAGGGDKKIETQKLGFREKASSKVGSKDNMGYQAGGGEKKIETQKLTFREKAKPKTDSGSSPHPDATSRPPENGLTEQTAAQ